MLKLIVVIVLTVVALLAYASVRVVRHVRHLRAWRLWRKDVENGSGRGRAVPCANCGLPMLPYEITLHNREGDPIHDNRPHFVMESSEKERCAGFAGDEYSDIGVEAAWPELRRESLLESSYFKNNGSKLVH